VSGRGTDFFISHAGRDTAWAEWLAWQLQQAGYSVELDVWDWAPARTSWPACRGAAAGGPAAGGVHRGLLRLRVRRAELRAAFAQSRRGGRIVPVLVEPVTLPRCTRR
jgi:hypothetical protein